jgi:DNA-binding CsgD family transcriptional regulator
LVLFGRADACARIDALLDSARAGSSGVLAIRGEPGIGKSALCRYAVQGATGLGVLTAQGLESDSELVFAGLFDLLRPITDLLHEIPEPQAAALGGALAITSGGASDRFAVDAGTLSLLAAAAEREPIVAVVDDAQWLDAPSIDALLFAARRLDADGVAIILSIREGEPRAFDPEGLPQLALEGLDADAAAALLAYHAGQSPLASAVAASLWGATAGNPLALEELPDILTAEQLAGTAPLDEPLPIGDAVSNAFRRRIARLHDDARRALLVAAASDRDSIDAILAALSQLRVDRAALDQAETSGLLTISEGRFTFRHPLVRSVLYHGAAGAERRDVHRALADVLEQAPERRAWHLAAAAIEPDPQVADALEQAALGARRRGGPATAARTFHRAATLSPEPSEQARLLREAADDAQLSGRSEWAIDLLDGALALVEDPLVRADLHEVRGRVVGMQGRALEAYEAMTAQAESILDLDPGRAALLFCEACYPGVMTGELDQSLAVAQRACDVAATVGGDALLLPRLARAGVRTMRGEAAEREMLNTIDAVLAAPNLPPTAVQPLVLGITSLTWVEEFDRARELLLPVVDGARAMGALGVLPFPLGAVAQLAFRTGDWTQALVNAAEAIQLGRDTGQEGMRGYPLAMLGHIEGMRGDFDAARAHASEALELANRFGYASVAVYARHALGAIELSAGRLEAAIVELEQVEALAEQIGFREPGMLQWEGDLIEAYARAGRAADASRMVTELERRAQRTGRAWAHAAAARGRGLLVGADEFEDAFAEALEYHARTPTPFERARTQLCLGERRRRDRRRRDSREPLQAALETFERLGANPWSERARKELGASGPPLTGRAAPSNALTPQELHIAMLVAEGSTNKEVAAALFLSPKTVEAHLGRVYRKLKLRSRTELALQLVNPASEQPKEGAYPR